MTDIFSDLEDEIIRGETSEEDREGPRYACSSCGGTGKWSRGTNRHGSKECFACNGRGWFKTTDAERRKSRQQRQTRKAKAVSAFLTQNEDLVRRLCGIASWNTFAASMVDQLGLDSNQFESRMKSIKGGFDFAGGKPLTDNQVAACERRLAKIEANRKARASEEKKAEVVVDLSPIREMFETALANGYKRPKYRAAGLVITRAPDTGRNPGALYIKNDETIYGGKVDGVTFAPSREGREAGFTPEGTAATALALIAKDPLEAALTYGRRTGRCACCGRELTNHSSIDAGIGPICAEKWGLS